ncbi:MAG: hypothetical protein KGI70_01425 [Patescibacteria group bacterium]|nr:hypothetical protein [Patescibacteria group bacterium]
MAKSLQHHIAQGAADFLEKNPHRWTTHVQARTFFSLPWSVHWFGVRSVCAYGALRVVARKVTGSSRKGDELVGRMNVGSLILDNDSCGREAAIAKLRSLAMA